jgi:hypothetical protein
MTKSFQEILFERMRTQLDPKFSLADVVADVLKLSHDACYRRIRGVTQITFDEAVSLARHTRISLNEIAGQADTTAVFEQWPIIKNFDDCYAYMQRSLESLERIKAIKGHMLYYQAKDIPVFYHFAFPKMARFKLYVWMKTIYDVQKIDGQNYNMDMIPQKILDLAQKQWEVFSQLNTIEIWNDTTVTSLVSQMEYYYEAGLLSSKEEAFEICDDFHKMMKNIYKQALQGNKVHGTNHDVFTGASYQMYYHEILLMDNTVLADMGDGRLSYFLPYAGVNYVSTTDPKVVAEIRDFVQAQARKSALISDVSEKDRNRFFIRIRNQIDQVRDKIKNTNPFL